MQKECILISQFRTFIEPRISNFQKPLITATEEKRKSFDCNIVSNNFSDFFNHESTPSKDTINTGNRHIDQKNRNLDLHDLIKLRREFENNPVTGYLNIKPFR